MAEAAPAEVQLEARLLGEGCRAAAACDGPCGVKTLSEPWKISLVQVSIALMQKGRRQLRDESGGKDPWLPIGVGLFQVSLLPDLMIFALTN